VNALTAESPCDDVERVPMLGAEKGHPVLLGLVEGKDVEPVHKPLDLRALVEPRAGPSCPAVTCTEEIHDDVSAWVGAFDGMAPETLERLRRQERQRAASGGSVA